MIDMMVEERHWRANHTWCRTYCADCGTYDEYVGKEC